MHCCTFKSRSMRGPKDFITFIFPVENDYFCYYTVHLLMTYFKRGSTLCNKAKPQPIVNKHLHSVWKSKDFSVIQILREINCREPRSSKTAVFAIFGALNIVDLVNFSHKKVSKFIKANSEPPNVLKWQMSYF